MLHIYEQDQQVAKILSDNGIKYRALYVANRELDPEWKCDEWMIFFNDQSFTFKTGLGSRLDRTKKGGHYNIMKFDRNTGEQLKKLREVVKVQSPKSVYFPINSDSINPSKFAVMPTQARVLHCLIVESYALETNFHDWCHDFGYDTDSIKALNLYNACCENARSLQAVIPRDVLRQIEEVLQDY